MDDRITLNAYADEVRELIHHNRNDEAIAICRHILHHYPKYIDAYRQMGEAFLEKEDLESAKDLFRRVLSADPENVIAYVGLSNIFEQQHVVNEAVWHLERAYELAPGNPELQKELVRLYNLIDIKAHMRAKLTHGALARVYAQEGLFNQAIQELRAIIASTPARFDIHVALAETLWRMGRMSEASQVAQTILTQLPYCLKANLILGAAWKETGLPESDKYFQRAQALDPTNQIATQVLGTRSPLPELEPSVPRYVETPAELTTAPFEFAPGETSAEETPIAEATPTISEFEASLTETPTETLTEFPSEPEASIESAPPIVTETQLPPWLRDQSETAPIGGETEVQPIEPAEELPAWLSQLRETTKEQPAEPAVPSDQTTTDWLAGLGQTETAEPVAPIEEPTPSAEETPAWMQDLQPSEPAPTSTPLTTGESADIEVTSPEELEALLKGLGGEAIPVEEPPVAEQPATRELPAQEELPPWLQGFEELGYKRESESETISPPDVTEMPSVEETPAWLSQLDETTPTAETPAVEPQPMVEEPSEVPPWITHPTQPAETITPMAEEPAVEPTTPVVEEPVSTWRSDLRERIDEAARHAAQQEDAMAPTEPPIAPTVPVPAPPAEPKRKRQPKGYGRLVKARAYRDANQLNEALVEYDYLVQKAPRLVNEVIDDLEVMIQRFDAPLEAHRILGDAYNRANRLGEALERYRFVLEHVS